MYELILSAFPVFAADITVDQNATGGKPTIDAAQNGVTFVNLAATTAGGVSHNKFTDFNVGSTGVILNNSKGFGTSQLGGALYGNPNYQNGGGPARIVLAEVTGSGKSSLKGYVEMFGKSADFVLANPNGIVCNGAGFINIPRVTLSTGTPVMENGYLTGLDVKGGTVSVEGKGIDARSVDYFTILSRVAAINGGVWGKDVTVMTGSGTFDYESKSFTSNEVAGDKPETGIDASAFGSKYAGRITLVSNEKGVGVRSDADMTADAGDIRITADGDIEIANTQATAGNIKVTSDTGTITQNKTSAASGSLQYEAAEITNKGKLFAEETLSIKGKTQNDGGTIESKGSIDIDADGGFSNKAGTVRGSKNIIIRGSVDNDDGTIAAVNDLTLVADGGLSNRRGKIVVSGDDGTLAIRSSGTIALNGGDVLSAGDIVLESGGDANVSADVASFHAGGDVNITAHNVSNNKKIEAAGDVRIDASGSVTENTESVIAAGDTLAIRADGDLISGGTLGGNSIDIDVSSLTNGAGAKITGGSGDTDITVTNAVINGGRISSASDLSLNAESVTNNGVNASIAAGEGLTLNADSITNNGGRFYSGEEMTVTAHSIDNERGWLYSGGDMTILEKGSSSSVYNYSGHIESEGDMTINLGNAGTITNTGKDSGGYTITRVTKGDYGDECMSIMEEDEITSNTMTTESGYIVSAKDMSMDASKLINHGSVISAAYDITINADLYNEANTLDVSLTQKSGQCHTWKETWFQRRRLRSKTHHEYTEDYQTHVETISSNTKPQIIAGTNIAIKAKKVDNGVIEKGKSVSLTNSNADTTYTPIVSKNSGIDLSQYSNIGPAGNAMFSVNTTPGYTFLIETREDFVDVSKLKGSQYFMDRIGYNPDRDVKFLGDAFYEQKIVTQGILEATSQRFLDDRITSDQQQMEWLIANAESAYRDYHLAVGVALTKDQINELQQPIVWYVEETVMGQTVLAPRIYIPEHILDGFSMSNAATISGKSVSIISDGNVTNSGVVSGRDTVTIKAENIINESGTTYSEINGGHVSLDAEDSIINTGATIHGDKEVSLVTTKGNIVNETSANENEFFGNTRSARGTTATIESDGTLTIKSGNNFENKGAQVTAGTDADIHADGNISFETVREVSSTKYTYGYEETTKVTGSTLTVGGNLSLASGGDTTFIGSAADIKGSADIDTGGNFNLINDYDTTYSEHTTESGGMFSSKTSHTVDSTKTVVSSAFNAGGDVNVHSDYDINIVGSSIKSDGSLAMEAGETQNIVAVHDEEYHLKETTKSGFGTGGSLYGSEKKSDMTDDKKAYASNVEVKEQYSSKSGKDTNITGSTIKAGESADIETGGNLNIAAAYDEHSEAHSEQSGGMLSGGTSLYQRQVDMEGNTSTKASGAEITAGNLTLKSGGDVLIEGSTVNAGQADIKAEGSITEKSAEEVNKSYSIHETINVTAGDVLKELGGSMGKFVLTGGLSSLQGKNSLDDFKNVKGIQFERGRLSAEVGKAEYSKETVNTTATTQASSTIAVNDSLAMESGKDIVVAGSDIKAGGDVSLDAAGDVRIETTEERTETTTERIEGKADLTVGVKHQSTEVAYAAKEVKDAYDKQKAAIDALNSYKNQIKKAEDDHEKGLITQDELDDIKDNLKYYEMAVGLAEAELAVKLAALVQQLAAAAASAETYGFTGDLQLKIDAEVEKIHEVSTKAKGSNITTGGNFTVTSGKTAKIEGSTVKSAGDVSIDADTVEILAGKNTSERSDDKKHATMTLTMSTGGASANISADFTTSGSESTSWTNSTLDGSNITIKSAKDTTVRGGNVTAANELTLDTGGNLTVESVQDTSRNKSVTIGVSAGGSRSGDNVGANLNISQEKSAWVNTPTSDNPTLNSQTSLKGGSVDIYVEDNTMLKGALITSTTGDLVLSTGTLEYENIQDRISKFNLGAGIGFDSTNTAGTQGTNNPQVGVGAMPENKPGTHGTTDVSGGFNSLSVGFSDKRQTNFATIGAGLITVRDTDIDLSKLNRDETVSQYGTMDAGVQLSADKDLLHIVDTATKTADAAVKIWDETSEVREIIGDQLEKSNNYSTTHLYLTNDELTEHNEQIVVNDNTFTNAGINIEGVNYCAAEQVGLERTWEDLIDENKNTDVLVQSKDVEDVLNGAKEVSAQYSNPNIRLQKVREFLRENAPGLMQSLMDEGYTIQEARGLTISTVAQSFVEETRVTYDIDKNRQHSGNFYNYSATIDNSGRTTYNCWDNTYNARPALDCSAFVGLVLNTSGVKPDINGLNLYGGSNAWGGVGNIVDDKYDVLDSVQNGNLSVGDLAYIGSRTNSIRHILIVAEVDEKGNAVTYYHSSPWDYNRNKANNVGLQRSKFSKPSDATPIRYLRVKE